MTVKDEVVSWLEAKMDCNSLEETKNFIRSHLTGIEEVAEETVRREGYSYPVQQLWSGQTSLRRAMGTSLFRQVPTRHSESRLGKPKPQLVCVLYRILFIDSVRAVVPEKGKSSSSMF